MILTSDAFLNDHDVEAPFTHQDVYLHICSFWQKANLCNKMTFY